MQNFTKKRKKEKKVYNNQNQFLWRRKGVTEVSKCRNYSQHFVCVNLFFHAPFYVSFKFVEKGHCFRSTSSALTDTTLTINTSCFVVRRCPVSG